MFSTSFWFVSNKVDGGNQPQASLIFGSHVVFQQISSISYGTGPWRTRPTSRVWAWHWRLGGLTRHG